MLKDPIEITCPLCGFKGKSGIMSRAYLSLNHWVRKCFKCQKVSAAEKWQQEKK